VTGCQEEVVSANKHISFRVQCVCQFFLDYLIKIVNFSKCYGPTKSTNNEFIGDKVSFKHSSIYEYGTTVSRIASNVFYLSALCAFVLEKMAGI
jgi:hypothetical protein